MEKIILLEKCASNVYVTKMINQINVLRDVCD